MKSYAVLCTACVAFAALAAAQHEPADTTAGDAIAKQEIQQIERERNRAILTSDTSTLDRMTSDDYTFITLRGELRTKAEIIQGFKSGSFHYDSRQISDLNVRVYGSTAIVTGRSVQKGKENGRD